jgi:hypothetical protein
MRWPAPVYEWGTTAAERAHDVPCDELLPEPDDVMFRAVDVECPPATLYRWLCQLRHAPYSYDKLDNFGRRSPQTLTPGAERLEVGQRMVAIFELAAFEPGRSVTLYSEGRLFGGSPVRPRRDHLRGAPARRDRIAPAREAAGLLPARPAVAADARAAAARRPGDDAPPAAQPEGARRARLSLAHACTAKRTPARAKRSAQDAPSARPGVRQPLRDGVAPSCASRIPASPSIRAVAR